MLSTSLDGWTRLGVLGVVWLVECVLCMHEVIGSSPIISSGIKLVQNALHNSPNPLKDICILSSNPLKDVRI